MTEQIHTISFSIIVLGQDASIELPMCISFFSWSLVADENIVLEARKSSKVSLLQGRRAKNTKGELYFYFSCYSTDLLFGYQITGWVWFSHTFAFHMLNRKSNNRLLLLLVGFRYSSSQNWSFF